MNLELLTYGLAAVLGSTFLSTLVSKWFDRRKDDASAFKVKAEGTDLLTQAWERSMVSLTKQLELQTKQIEALQRKLDRAYSEIRQLRAELRTHERSQKELRLNVADALVEHTPEENGEDE